MLELPLSPHPHSHLILCGLMGMARWDPPSETAGMATEQPAPSARMLGQVRSSRIPRGWMVNSPEQCSNGSGKVETTRSFGWKNAELKIGTYQCRERSYYQVWQMSLQLLFLGPFVHQNFKLYPHVESVTRVT